MINQRALIAILSISGTFLAQNPASAQLGIEFAKDLIRQCERDRKDNPGSYASLVFALAEEYQMYGQIQKAESTFRQSLKLYQLDWHEATPNYRASILLSWAQVQSQGMQRVRKGEEETQKTGDIIERKLNKDDFRRIDKATLEALEEANKSQDTSSGKARVYLSAIDLFEKTGNRVEKEKCENHILSVCKVYEQEANVHADVLYEYAEILNRMGDRTVHMQSPRDKPAYQIELDNNEFHTTERFSKAEKMKLAALRLFDKLPKDNQYRIGAHRSMALWYMLFKKDAEAARETKVLSELMGTTDEKVLFPKYLGCGQFENSKQLGQLCGMG